MGNLVVMGMQWGDEGKGKVVDLISPSFDAVARYQGGNNAGHTVKFGDRHFSLHLLPSGIVREGVQCFLGHGMVIDPDAFFAEVDKIEAAGIVVRGRLMVSDRAHVVLPCSAQLDKTREAAAGKDKIGTTGRGIGPTYEAKAGRLGVRICDLTSPNLEDRLRAQLVKVEAESLALGGERMVRPAALADQCRAWGQALAPFVGDTVTALHEVHERGKSILLEGAQGTLLDLDLGTYPFVTSSTTSAAGAASGTGLPPTALTGVLGVLKAYTTRVGAGPFPGELLEETGEYLRTRGNEFGTTTGRPRRCGWLDLVGARFARRVNGVGGIALTKLDVLDTFTEIPIGVAYDVRGKVVDTMPASLDDYNTAKPVYRTVPGWNTSTVGITRFEDLPAEARAYVELVEDEVGAPVVLVSTGPRREETILRRDSAFGRMLF
jgi:adenylosuccinate synthase